MAEIGFFSASGQRPAILRAQVQACQLVRRSALRGYLSPI